MYNKTKEIDNELLKLLSNDNPKIGYIPSCSDVNRKYFNERKEHYRKLGITDLIYFDLDKEYDESKLCELLTCDAIHLSGGDTYNFLKLIKKRNFDKTIIEYVNNGGILIGISAGAMIMSHNIDICWYDNLEELSNHDTDSLGLTNFEFMPHFERGTMGIERLIMYSRVKSTTVYACNDGEGIIVNGNEIKAIGNVIKIVNGVIATNG